MSLTQIEFQAEGAGDLPTGAIQGRSPWRLAWRRLRRDKVAVASAVVIVVLAVAALAAPLIAALTGHPPNTPYPNNGLSATGLPVPPSGTFLFGTDNLGRDLLVRVVYGARISLLVGLAATAIATLGGVAVGMCAGYFGGVIDAVLARIVDSVLATPYVILALAIIIIFGQRVPSLVIVIGVIAFFSWAAIARVVRGQTLSIREKEYIEAARSVGAGPLRIMFVDILPNLIAPVLVLATLAIPNAIVFESTLSFLGVGIQPPTASWGNLLASAQDFPDSWWFLLFPAGFLLLTTLAFNLLGDGIRDALDPRTERLFASKRRRAARAAARHRKVGAA
ncbi:MAG TPA: ABC transporter permease [Streptosporangiaceae bacterium]